jgi:hypothetical protein
MKNGGIMLTKKLITKPPECYKHAIHLSQSGKNFVAMHAHFVRKTLAQVKLSY